MLAQRHDAPPRVETNDHYYHRLKKKIRKMSEESVLRDPALHVMKRLHLEINLNILPEGFLRDAMQHVDRLISNPLKTNEDLTQFQNDTNNYHRFLWWSGTKGVGKLLAAALFEMFTFAFIAANIIGIAVLAVFCPPAAAIPLAIFGTMLAAGLIAPPAIFGVHLYSSGRHQVNSARNQYGFYSEAAKLGTAQAEVAKNTSLVKI